MSDATVTTISVSREIAAPAEVVWGMISDVPRMGEWSPETTGCEWSGGVERAAVGAKFVGRNVNGAKKWNTACTVTDCEPGSVFAFDSKSVGLPIAGWAYRFEPTDQGCRVTETWTDKRGWLVKTVSPWVSGVQDRATHNEATMTESLKQLAAAAEATTH